MFFSLIDFYNVIFIFLFCRTSFLSLTLRSLFFAITQRENSFFCSISRTSSQSFSYFKPSSQTYKCAHITVSPTIIFLSHWLVPFDWNYKTTHNIFRYKAASKNTHFLCIVVDCIHPFAIDRIFLLLLPVSNAIFFCNLQWPFYLAMSFSKLKPHRKMASGSSYFSIYPFNYPEKKILHIYITISVTQAILLPDFMYFQGLNGENCPSLNVGNG